MEEVVSTQAGLLPSSKWTGEYNMAFAYSDGKIRIVGELTFEDAAWAIGDMEPMTHCPCCERPLQNMDQEDDEEECQ